MTRGGRRVVRALRAAGTVSATRRTALTQTAPTATNQRSDRDLVSVQFPARLLPPVFSSPTPLHPSSQSCAAIRL